MIVREFQERGGEGGWEESMIQFGSTLFSHKSDMFVSAPFFLSLFPIISEVQFSYVYFYNFF